MLQYDTMREVILSVNGLTKDFGKARAVDAVSFTVERGEIVGLLGPNGAGKTTTIQMMLDIVTPTAGTVQIFGKDPRRERERIFSRLNFSSAYVALPLNLTVWENLATFARLYGVRSIRKRIDEVAATFSIGELLKRRTATLSSGQLTRLNLAKAFLNEPELLFLDEPTVSLDPDIADRTLGLLERLHRENGLTIFYTSHDMAEVERLTDRVIFLLKGKIIEDTTAQKLIAKYGRKDLEETFLKLVREVPKGEA